MESDGAAPRVLAVQRGLVLPPGVLRALLPDVASVVTNAISGASGQIFGLRKQKDAKSALNRKRPVRPTASESQPQTTNAWKEPRHARNILNPFPCNICKQRFPSRQSLNTHWLVHDNQCTYCKTSFESRVLLLKHLCCTLCKKLYRTKLEYKRHMTQHARPVHKCGICKVSFSKKTDLIEHKNEMNFGCQTCRKCFRSSKEHVEHSKPAGQSQESEFLCKQCGECFEESFSFTSHMRNHTGPVKSYSRAPKKPKLNETRQDEGVETSKTNLKKKVNEIDNRSSIKKSDFKEEPSDLELNDDMKKEVLEYDGIKVEPELDVSREARTSLYAGHQIHRGMVLGPVRVLPADIVYTIQNDLLNKTKNNKQMPVSESPSTSPTAEPCPVKIEPAVPVEEVDMIDSKTSFSSIKTESIV